MSGRISSFFSISSTSLLAALLFLLSSLAFGQGIPAGPAGYRDHVRPFFAAHCIKCHGPEKSKGKLALHAIEGDLSAGQDLQRWELILEMIRGRKMPPEEEPSPEDSKRQAVAKWIEAGLRDYVEKASAGSTAPMSRRVAVPSVRMAWRLERRS